MTDQPEYDRTDEPTPPTASWDPDETWAPSAPGTTGSGASEAPDPFGSDRKSTRLNSSH